MSTPITHTVSHFCEALIYDDSPLLEGDVPITWDKNRTMWIEEE